MKKGTVLLMLMTVFCVSGVAQELGFDIFNTYSKPIVKELLVAAKTMVDIKSDYPSSWIKEEDYISTLITVIGEGELMKAVGSNEYLTSEQMELLKKADTGSNIDFMVKYYSENSVTNKVVTRTMNFSVSLVPEIEAEFPGGREKMLEYLKNKAVVKINTLDFTTFEMAKVGFLIDTEGTISKTRIVQSTENEKIDQLLLKIVNRMPKWNPAISRDGERVNQEFELVVGTMIGC